VTKTWDLYIAESKYKKVYLSKINLAHNENGYLLVLAWVEGLHLFVIYLRQNETHVSELVAPGAYEAEVTIGKLNS
jgi:hypothetical protein